MNTWTEAAKEFRVLVQVGVVKGKIVKESELEQLVADQAEVLRALSAEYGKNLYKLWKMKGEFTEMSF
jgi:hypothetical protein